MKEKKKSGKRWRGLYKFIRDNEVLYVGMSNSDVFKRIECHRKEDKFLPYLNESEVLVYIADDTKNNNFIKICETALIDQYRPILNRAEKPSFSSNMDFETLFELKFVNYQKAYEEYCVEREKKCMEKKETKKDRELLRLERRISEMEDIVESNIDAIKLLMAVLESVFKGNYKTIKDENTQKEYKELNISALCLPYNGIIYTTGKDEKEWLLQHLNGWYFFLKKAPGTSNKELYCRIREQDLINGEEYNSFINNFKISFRYLAKLYDQKKEMAES